MPQNLLLNHLQEFTEAVIQVCQLLNCRVSMSTVSYTHLSPEIMVQRAMSVTGATDEYQVGQMVQVVNDIAEYCRNHGVTDGSYGMRSLIDWIISSEITNNVYESALYTVISKATSDEMEREALISSVLEPIFAPSRKRVTA